MKNYHESCQNLQKKEKREKKKNPTKSLKIKKQSSSNRMNIRQQNNPLNPEANNKVQAYDDLIKIGSVDVDIDTT